MDRLPWDPWRCFRHHQASWSTTNSLSQRTRGLHSSFSISTTPSASSSPSTSATSRHPVSSTPSSASRVSARCCTDRMGVWALFTMCAAQFPSWSTLTSTFVAQISPLSLGILADFDCLKPYCSWPDNVAGKDKTLMPFCTADDKTYNMIYKGGFACTRNAPWQDPVHPMLSYGFVSIHESIGVCGNCFLMEFVGPGPHSPGDAGSRQLIGRRMIVQATSIHFSTSEAQCARTP